MSRLSRREKFLFIIATIAFIVSSFTLIMRFERMYMVEVPTYGGVLREGIIGRPRFINPVLAKSDADRDMTELVFSGLLKATPDGKLIPALAESYTISPDGLVYTFTLKDNLSWHDGEPLTAQDVVFTIEKVQDKSLAIKSPRRASWDDVSVESPDERTIVFKLKQPYAPFLDNATMGIIPKHVWEKIPNDEFDVSYYNVEPIGSGPYRYTSMIKDTEKGLPTAYVLTSFRNYALGRPFISNLTIFFYGNSKELTSGYQNKEIDQIHTIDPSVAKSLESQGAIITHTELPRTFAAFINATQNPALQDKAVREALHVAVDKEQIIDQVLYGYGETIDGPLPYIQATTSIRDAGKKDQAQRANEARHILEAAGWSMNPETKTMEFVDKKKKKTIPLEFSISVPDVDELTRSAQFLKEDWERIGAHVTVKVFELSTFSVEVLASRKYDVLFYGQVIGRTPDLFPYWHSTQRIAPGLNVALYTSRPADKLLEDIRKTSDESLRTELLLKFNDELQRDTPAIFVYSPYFLYVRSASVHGAKTDGIITTESERFLDIQNWYIESDHVWRFFAKLMDRNKEVDSND
jgi:peptide/nickel transport system substrate-binding protein